MQTLSDTFTVSPLPQQVAQEIRSSLRDGFGNELETCVDGGGAPCRSCLRLTQAGERVILFSHRPFPGPGLYQEVGPVFIHAQPCKPFSGSGVPPDFRSRALVLRPYDASNHIAADQKIVGSREAQDAIHCLLSDPRVAYLHARSVSRGCYLFRIDRSQAK